MTISRDEVLRMAREAKCPHPMVQNSKTKMEFLERFTALVAAAERKRCKDAIKGCRKSPENFDSGDVYIGYDDAIDDVLTSLDEI